MFVRTAKVKKMYTAFIKEAVTGRWQELNQDRFDRGCRKNDVPLGHAADRPTEYS